MSFIRNITIVYSNKGRGMDTLASHYLTSSYIVCANARTHLLYTPWHDTKYKVLMSCICRANAQTHLEYTPWHDTKIQGINEFFYAKSPSSIPIKEEAWTP
jgi:hypothetical protein